MTVRRAGPDDAPALADTLTAAFDGGPWATWVVDARDHTERLRSLYAIYLDVALRSGEVWMAEDAAGCAAWTWSAHPDLPALFAEHDPRVLELTGDRIAAAEAADAVISARSPTEPHWYLAAVGVHPSRQGQGLGTALLAPVLERCDAEGHLAALETSVAANVRLYERLGFTVTDEAAIDGGPPLWFMRRYPAGTNAKLLPSARSAATDPDAGRTSSSTKRS